MMDDIKSGKDNVSYVLVFKLSRFGRNAADTLSSLQTMQDYDVNLICKEIETLGKKLRQCNSKRDVILNDIDNLDVDDKHYTRRKADLENSLYKIYDKIEELENLIMDARAKRKTVIADKMSVDNVYKAIIYIDKYIDKMDQQERRDFIEQIISEVNIYEDKTPEGQWIKSVKFRLPLITEDML